MRVFLCKNDVNINTNLLFDAVRGGVEECRDGCMSDTASRPPQTTTT
jgi:hypothetical protein